MNQLVLLTQAYDFAAKAHVNQRRKGDALEPYINHLTEVASLIAAVTNGQDPELIAAAILHDTVEDTHVTIEMLQIEFGPRVASIVAEVTDNKSLPKQERKRLQVISVFGKSPEAKMLKLADKTSNLRAILNSPPPWELSRKAEYLNWARKVISGARGINSALEARFDEAACKLEESLELPFEVTSYDCWKMYTDEDCYGSEGKFASFEDAQAYCAREIDEQISKYIELSEARPLTEAEIKEAVSELSTFGWSYSIKGSTPEAKQKAEKFFFLDYARARLSKTSPSAAAGSLRDSTGQVSLTYEETIRSSDEVDSRVYRAWLDLPKEVRETLNFSEWQKQVQPKIREQVLKEMGKL